MFTLQHVRALKDRARINTVLSFSLENKKLWKDQNQELNSPINKYRESDVEKNSSVPQSSIIIQKSRSVY